MGVDFVVVAVEGFQVKLGNVFSVTEIFKNSCKHFDDFAGQSHKHCPACGIKMRAKSIKSQGVRSIFPDILENEDAEDDEGAEDIQTALYWFQEWIEERNKGLFISWPDISNDKLTKLLKRQGTFIIGKTLSRTEDAEITKLTLFFEENVKKEIDALGIQLPFEAGSFGVYTVGIYS